MHMKHLSPDELIDLAEGVRTEIGAPHLANCGACRRQLAELRAALLTFSNESAADVPEPSPLFWDHFSARVREAVAAEGSRRHERGWDLLKAWSRPQWLGAVPLAGAGALIAVVIALASYVMAPRVSDLPAVPTESINADVALPALGAADDPTLSLVADLTAGLDLDGAGEAGLTAPAHAGGAVDVVSMLTADERRELQRLLQEELAKHHA
jgi:hypothetical protein